MLNVKLVAEGANGPTNTDGDMILQSKGIDVIPDILCNSGGLIGSYFEWLQNKRSEFWEIDEVDDKLHKKIVNVYERVHDTTRSSTPIGAQLPMLSPCRVWRPSTRSAEFSRDRVWSPLKH